MTEVVELDLANESQFAAFYDAYTRSYDRPFDTLLGPREKHLELTPQPWKLQPAAVVLATGNGSRRAVGGAVLNLPLRDNLELCYAQFWVNPAHRHHGYGSTLLEWVLEQARERGRHVLIAPASWGVDGSGNTAEAFLERRGFRRDQVEAQRALELPAQLPSAPVAPGYSLIHWRQECPEQWLAQCARLRALLPVEAPSGEVYKYEEEAFDPERLRLEEAQFAATGRTRQSTAAVAPDGTLAGHTQLVFPSEDPRNAYQWDTLVLPGHRGRGLGLALKVANMRAASDLLVGRHRIHTWNAADNGPMIRVNEAMGFRVVGYWAEMVRTLS